MSLQATFFTYNTFWFSIYFHVACGYYSPYRNSKCYKMKTVDSLVDCIDRIYVDLDVEFFISSQFLTCPQKVSQIYYLHVQRSWDVEM